MGKNQDYSESEEVAWKKGFLFGFYEDYPKDEHQLLNFNPFPVGSSEHDAWVAGYYSNL